MMQTENPTIDRMSALRYVRQMESRIGDRLEDALNEIFEETESPSIETFRECLMGVFQCALEASDKETIMPDYDTLSSSLADIRNGRCYDLQEVIDELSGTHNGYSS